MTRAKKRKMEKEAGERWSMQMVLTHSPWFQIADGLKTRLEIVEVEGKKVAIEKFYFTSPEAIERELGVDTLDDLKKIGCAHLLEALSNKYTQHHEMEVHPDLFEQLKNQEIRMVQEMIFRDDPWMPTGDGMEKRYELAITEDGMALRKEFRHCKS